MTSFRFVHAADLHLDTPFEGIGVAAPHVADALREASLSAWDALVQLCIDQQAAFLLLAGDVYDGAQRGVRAQFRLLRGLEALAEHGIQAFIVHGNHDPVDEGWTGIRFWPSTVTVFPPSEVLAVPAVWAGRQVATVHGISYPSRACTDNLTALFSAIPGSSLAAQGIQIGLLHCNAGSSEHAQYSPCSVSDLLRSGLDYWALGHVHRRQYLREGDPWVVYPGNLQGRSPRPAEAEPKGAVVVDVVDDRVRQLRFVACDSLRFQRVSLDVSGLPDLAALHDALLIEASSQQSAAADRGLLLRVELSGRGPVHDDLQVPDAAPELLRALREQSLGAVPLVWWESIRDATGGQLDMGAIRTRGDFAAELVTLADSLRADPSAIERLLGPAPADLRHVFPLERLQIDKQEALALLDQAEAAALDLLEAGEQ